jgi:CheY-like chemotaxis protein
MIGQVIDNIVINAQQSMPGGGTIYVRAHNISLNEKDHLGLARGDYVRISIKDSGIGIPSAILPRIFEPFFTTKTKGHGLGLATCYSIVKRHGGAIDVDSQPGKGSTFFVYLPASAGSVSLPTEVMGEPHKGTGTILVMDDQAIIRETVTQMLRALGYSVVCKDNGRDAIDFFVSETNAHRKIAGMILDLTIPGGMGGEEAIIEIRKLDKDIPVIVSSGYSDDPVIASPTSYGFTTSIRKPFTQSELTEVLRKNVR